MLEEIQNIKQLENEPKRRWYSNEFFDLIVWFSTESEVVGFQLCYDIPNRQRALTWLKESGFSHGQVDEGESNPGKVKESPTIVAGGEFAREKIARKFVAASKNIDSKIAQFVFQKIMESNLFRN